MAWGKKYGAQPARQQMDALRGLAEIHAAECTCRRCRRAREARARRAVPRYGQSQDGTGEGA